MSMDYNSESEHNCDGCSFQGHSEIDLKKHHGVCKHRATSGGERVNPNAITCHSCGLEFRSRRTLMNHRKDAHPDRIKTCKYFLKDTCDFTAEECWFRHEMRQVNENSNEDLSNNDIQCNVCKQVFTTQADLMDHRKQEHRSIVTKCRDYPKGECTFSNEECWYIHNDEPEVNGNAKCPVFCNAQEHNHPPDMMKRIVDMMEKVMEKVQILERRTDQFQ